MQIEIAMQIYATAAGTQVTDSGQGDAWIKNYLRKKQDKLDKTRRALAPFPEDKKGINAVKKEVGHWSPAPEDVAQIKKKSYKSGMRKAKTVPRASLHTAPGAVPLQDVTGQESIGSVHCIIRKKGNQYCVLSEDGSKNLGCSPNKAGAHKRLAEVEYFKNKKG